MSRSSVSQIAVRAVRVQALGRLVEEQHRREVDQRRREVDASLHPARVLAHPPAGGVAEAEQVEQQRGAPRGLAAREAVQTAVQHEQFAARGELVDADLLHREADPPAHLPRLPRDVVAGHGRPAGRRPDQRPEHAHRRRLAGAVGAEDAEHLARAHAERDAAHRVGAVRVALGERLDDDRVVTGRRITRR